MTSACGWRDGQHEQWRFGSFREAEGSSITVGLRSVKSMRGNRMAKGIPMPSRDWSSEEGRGVLKKGRAATGPRGLGLMIRGSLCRTRTSQGVVVAVALRKCTDGPCYRAKPRRPEKRSGWSGTPSTVSTPQRGQQTPERGEEPYEGNWICRWPEMAHGGQSATDRSDSEEGLNRKRGSWKAERRFGNCSGGQTARRCRTARRES